METIQQTLTAVMVKINYFIHKNVLFCSQQLDFVLKKVVYKAINWQQWMANLCWLEKIIFKLVCKYLLFTNFFHQLLP